MHEKIIYDFHYNFREGWDWVLAFQFERFWCCDLHLIAWRSIASNKWEQWW